MLTITYLKIDGIEHDTKSVFDKQGALKQLLKAQVHKKSCASIHTTGRVATIELAPDDHLLIAAEDETKDLAMIIEDADLAFDGAFQLEILGGEEATIKLQLGEDLALVFEGDTAREFLFTMAETLMSFSKLIKNFPFDINFQDNLGQRD